MLDRPAAAAVAQKAGYGRRATPASVDASRDTPVVARTRALVRVTVAPRRSMTRPSSGDRGGVLQRMYDAWACSHKRSRGVQLGWLGAALVAASLSKEGRSNGSRRPRRRARPFLPFAREDRSRRAHSRPSSTTPRRAGPHPDALRRFSAEALQRVRRRAPVAVDVRQGPGKTTGEAVNVAACACPRERRDETSTSACPCVLYIFLPHRARLASCPTPPSRPLSLWTADTRAKRHAPANRRKTEMTPRLRR